MARAEYNKLVRDKIPDIIRSNGDAPITHIADDAEYKRMLDEKLNEECKEFLDSRSKEELADILEVIYAIGESLGAGKDELERIRVEKLNKRGSFSKRIILDRTQ